MHAYTTAHTKGTIQFQCFSYITSEKAWKDNTERSQRIWRMMTKEIVQKSTLAKIKSPTGRKRVLVYGQKV